MRDMRGIRGGGRFPGDEPGRAHAFRELCLLVVIGGRSQSKKVTDILRANRMPGHYVFHAEGTAASVFVDLLGIGAVEKAVTLGFATRDALPPLMARLHEELHLAKAGNGIAFSVPLSGIIIPLLSLDPSVMAGWQNHIESEADTVNQSIDHDLIVALADEGRCDEIVAAAHGAGAAGGVTFHALHFGARNAAKFFGIPMQEKKDVVVFLVKRKDKPGVMDAVNEALGATHKIIFTLPADNVTGFEPGGNG
jgi:hypothetical protein